MNVSPQCENGYTRFANQLFDHIIKFRMPSEVRQCFDAIARESWGYGFKFVRTELSDIAQMTGIRRPHVSRSVSRMMRHNLLKSVPNEVTEKQIRTKRGTVRAQVLGINKNFAEWIPFKKRTKRGTESVPNEVRLGGLHHYMKEKRNIEGANTRKRTKRGTDFKYKKSVSLPDDFRITENMISYAKKLKFCGSLEEVTEDFMIHHRKKGSKFVDWYAAWQNWMRNEKEWHPEKFGAAQKLNNRQPRIYTEEEIDQEMGYA